MFFKARWEIDDIATGKVTTTGDRKSALFDDDIDIMSVGANANGNNTNSSKDENTGGEVLWTPFYIWKKYINHILHHLT